MKKLLLVSITFSLLVLAGCKTREPVQTYPVALPQIKLSEP